MADPNTQAPDLQSATGVPAPPAPMSQPGLIDALRSQGTPPLLPANMLSQSMQQSGPGPSIGLAMGSGALNAGSGGNAALNPYLQQYQAQQNAQVQEALHYQHLQQQQAAQQLHRDELSNAIYKDLLFGPNAVEDEKVRGPLAAQYGQGISKVTGSPLSTGLVQSMTKGGPSMTSLKNLAILANMADTEQDPLLKQSKQQDAIKYFAQHGGDPAKYEETAAKLRDPLFRRMASLPDDESMQMEKFKLQDEMRKNWIGSHPEFADIKNEQGHTVVAGVTGYGDEIIRKMTRGQRSLFDLNDKVPLDKALIDVALDGGRAMAKAEAQKRTEQKLEADMQLAQKKSDIIKERTGQLMEKRKELFPSQAGVMKPEDVKKALAPFAAADDAQGVFAQLEGSLDRMAKKGLVPTGPGPGQALSVKIQEFLQSGDSDATVFKKNILPAIIGLVDRGLMDEKNVRFKEAFIEKTRLAQQTPTLEAFKKLGDMYRYAFAVRAARQLYNLEATESARNPAVVKLAQDHFNVLYPQGMPGDPSLLKPGTHYEYRNKQAIMTLDNGKGEFDPATQQWVPKR